MSDNATNAAQLPRGSGRFTGVPPTPRIAGQGETKTGVPPTPRVPPPTPQTNRPSGK